MRPYHYLRLIIIFCFFIIDNAVSGQSLTNKKLTGIEDRMRYFYNNNPDSVPVFCGQLIHSSSGALRTYGHASLSYYYCLSGKNEKDKKELAFAKSEWHKLKPSVQKDYLHATVLNFEASSLKHKGLYGQALKIYLAGKSIAKKCSNIPLEIRFVHNISDIQAKSGDLSEAIQNAKKELQLITKYKESFTPENYDAYHFNVLISLGQYYNDYFHDIQQRAYLDSSKYYYNRALVTAENGTYNYALCELNLGGVYIELQDFFKATELLEDARTFFHNYAFVKDEERATFNLALAFYELKKDESALENFNRFDALFIQDSSNLQDYVRSTYCQAIIYKRQGREDLYNEKYDAYLSVYEQLLKKQSEHKVKVNELILKDSYNDKLETEKWKFESTTKVLLFTILSLVLVIGIVVIRAYFRKKPSGAKTTAVVQLIDTKQDEEEGCLPGQVSKVDEETEREILRKLKKLEEEEYFLRPDFKLQVVAKKIRTNTSYLSNVVNANFGQTFSEYSSELRLGYIISKLESDPMYREYSTQALAESIGYKNAISFAKSFSKRTGFTPYQYVLNLKKQEV